MKRSRALALTAGALACGTRSARAAEPASLTIINLPSDTGGQIYYAQDLGYFKAAGLDVKINAMTSSPAIVAALASGGADIGFSVVGSAAVARQRGIPLRFIAPGALWLTVNGTAQIVVPKDAPLAKPADFVGKTVAVTGLADLTYYGARAWLEKGGVDSSKVKFVEMPFPQMGAAVATHRVDAAAMAEPFMTAARNDVREIAPFDDAIAPRFMSTGWVATDAWIKAHPDVAARFAQVMRQTAQWANAHKKESGEILERYVKLSPETVAVMHRVDYALTLDPRLIQPPLDIAQRYTPSAQPISAAELIWSPS